LVHIIGQQNPTNFEGSMRSTVYMRAQIYTFGYLIFYMLQYTIFYWKTRLVLSVVTTGTNKHARFIIENL